MSGIFLLLAATVPAAGPLPAPRHFIITIVDDQTGRGVPLVELRTVHEMKFYTDSAGVVVIREPDLLGQTTYFHIRSHGYEFAKDGFGYRGKALHLVPGGEAELKIRRINRAERLYRITGAGIYAESVLAGRKVPLREPLLNGQVFGSDSVLTAAYQGKLFWVWGDTNRPSYPLGNFQVAGAVSELPGKGLAPATGIDLRYFTDGKGFAQQMAPMPGTGPTWITALLTLPEHGKERLFASYVKVKPPLTIYARGLAVFDDQKRSFTHRATLDMKAPIQPEGHSFLHKGDDGEHVYFCHPFPLVRVKADAAAFARLTEYETFSCLTEGSRLESAKIDRDEQGRPVYRWRRDVPVLTPTAQGKWLPKSALKRTETLLQLRDRDSGKAITAHAGSVVWNAYRRRWVMIAVQVGGSSFLGEVWYAEADTPTGPWAYAVKVASHDRYSFYNPKHHALFDEERGRIIYFEGTYTHTFSGNNEATPRYDYNQMMYRLDLGRKDLSLPVAIVNPDAKARPAFFSPRDAEQMAFFALDRPGVGSVAIVAERDKGTLTQLRVAKAGESAFFHGMPENADSPGTVPLWECVHEDGRRRYVVGDALPPARFVRGKTALCRVWPSPWR